MFSFITNLLTSTNKNSFLYRILGEPESPVRLKFIHDEGPPEPEDYRHSVDSTQELMIASIQGTYRTGSTCHAVNCDCSFCKAGLTSA